MPFAHEQLLVYQKALDFFAEVQPQVKSWNKRHAFVDHLARASESILFNLVEASRLRLDGKKMLCLDYSLGSGFECAACLDIAVLKNAMAHEAAQVQKQALLEICKMLIGLRNSWKPSHVAEDETPYSAVSEDKAHTVFHHETLDMYSVALGFCRWFISTKPGRIMNSTFARSIDKLATRVVLNIAESNGRYAELSRQTFLDTANGAAARLAASLDMGLRKGLWTLSEIEQGKRLLVKIGQMTAKKDY